MFDEPVIVKTRKSRKSTKTAASPAPVKATRAKRVAPHKQPDPKTHEWCHWGVVSLTGLSAVLNAYHAWGHSPVPALGAAISATIPVIALLLARVAAGSRRYSKPLSNSCAGVAGILLLLSVYHCGDAIASLVGCSLWLGLPLALAIDAGLVLCKVGTVVVPKSV